MLKDKWSCRDHSSRGISRRCWEAPDGEHRAVWRTQVCKHGQIVQSKAIAYPSCWHLREAVHGWKSAPEHTRYSWGLDSECALPWHCRKRTLVFNFFSISGHDFVGKKHNQNTALPVLKARGCMFGAFCDNFVGPTGLASNRPVARISKRYSVEGNRAAGWGTLDTGSNTFIEVNLIDKIRVQMTCRPY